MRIKGPIVAQTTKSGCKCIYSEPNREDAIHKAARFLKLDPAAFRAGNLMPRTPPTLGKRPADHSIFPASGVRASISSWPAGVRLSVEGRVIRTVGSGTGEVFFRGASASVDHSAPAPLGRPSDEQAAVIDLAVRQRRSIFITGSAGTGKSFVLKHIRQGEDGTLPLLLTRMGRHTHAHAHAHAHTQYLCTNSRTPTRARTRTQDWMLFCQQGPCMSQHLPALLPSRSTAAPSTLLPALVSATGHTTESCRDVQKIPQQGRDGSKHSASSLMRCP